MKDEERKLMFMKIQLLMEIEESIRVDNYHKKMKATSLQQKVAFITQKHGN
jgi:hypothetical protein